uniref:Programmed cell death protein 5 n=1 Tax=Pyramimonas obovata TaxID=1411642 RepID=A0A7S0RRG1_9CHLO|mmetsp:Transcript_39742/g.86529  ORF Transcript_39742/g.86529 Transcript_39742/m.86529 type:complete len:129 (+) Transcript_39742:85-471(+)|eukprot:CAMPEP_0118932220 /NCGR_PEP_ID=MMETSP1169-20130426/9505_1 /TAXON_ID=36882 /ORGANISM="Pyramimonas obovata, Strain CCMP722" /LENGTH=128 /DNA_ID=CAMNT_0006874843 /DNA_START=85 /DNA_END=471 /DNA_ORIENTATION=+
MDDPQLEAIRQQRMAQLGAQGGEMPDQQQMQAQEEQKRAMEEQRAQMLQAFLQPAARERLTRISLVKPEKARKVEDMVLTMAQRGQLGGPVDEKQLIKWLEQISGGGEEKAKVTINHRRRNIMDDDDW